MNHGADAIDVAEIGNQIKEQSFVLHNAPQRAPDVGEGRRSHVLRFALKIVFLMDIAHHRNGEQSPPHGSQHNDKFDGHRIVHTHHKQNAD